MAGSTEHEVLDVQEAAALLRVAPDAVTEEAASGRLPGRRIGGEWRFARAGLLEWLRGQDMRPHASEPDPQAALAATEGVPPTPAEAASRDDTDALGEQ